LEKQNKIWFFANRMNIEFALKKMDFLQYYKMWVQFINPHSLD
jgi:hypothetical protein